MPPLISCPSCARSLGKVSNDGTFQAVCTSCRHCYGAVYGKVSKQSSSWEALLYLGPKVPSFYKRNYEFRITTPGRRLKSLKFSIPGKAEQICARTGDWVSILYFARGYSMERLVSVHNHTTNSHYTFPTPIPSQGYLAATRGSTSLLVFLYALFNGVSLPLTSGLSLVSALLYSKLVNAATLTTPELRMNVSDEAHLIAEQQLAAQKTKLLGRIEALRHDHQTHQRLVERLEALKTKMLNVSETLYATRIENVRRAIMLIQQRTQDEQKLMHEYSRTIQMIEIELETSHLADQLPEVDDFTGTILTKLDELKAIENHNQALQLQLEANEEVRRLRW
ncbi:MAG: hypothetical protein F6K19_01055 [Cyanothece sp. SIO1E1]|nr:hypothetical protein [Cyanothece sp. SIO1E1]